MGYNTYIYGLFKSMLLLSDDVRLPEFKESSLLDPKKRNS